MITFGLQVAALVCFVLGTIRAMPARVSFTSLGLLLWLLSLMLGGVAMHQAH